MGNTYIRRFRTIATVLIALGVASSAAAQGRIRGVVQDTDGQPIKGAIVRATDANTTNREWTSTTDDKGRFVFLGLRVGANWIFKAEAPGYAAMEGSAPVRSVFGPPVTFSLPRDLGPLPGALSKDIQEQLASANALRDQGRHEQAIAAYQSIRARNPKLTTINLVLAGAYRQQAERERDTAARLALLTRAASAYDEVLRGDADNELAKNALATLRATLNDPK
jgi:Carboxypeptidase regulatory-like domain